ncbi:MAG: SGNH/GDSL hydrolase family protein [Lentisphaeria bacterium]|nr:SGNH/GDSL hydrolase family protein [Lentisphaeria bacterium]
MQVECKRFFLGAVDVLDDPRGFLPSRFTPALRAFYGDSEARVIRANSPTGVRIAMITDSPSVRIRVAYGRAAREKYALSVRVDDDSAWLCAPAQPRATRCDFSIGLPSGRHWVEIGLPHLVETFVESVDIADGAHAEPVPAAAGRTLFVGDSIMQGMTTEALCRSYFDIVARGLAYDYVNVSVGGATAAPGLAQCLGGYSDWDLALVSFGTNDCTQNRPLEEYAASLAAIITALQCQGRGKLCLLTTVPRPAQEGTPNAIGKTLDDYRQAARALQTQFPELIVLEGPAMLPADERLLADGIHPNDAGSAVMARNILAALA